MHRLAIAILAAGTLGPAIAACGTPGPGGRDAASPPGDGVPAPAASAPAPAIPTLRVVATTSLVGDVVRVVGGDRVALTVLVPAATDPHGFEPAPRDAAAIAAADAVVMNGLGIDDYLVPLVTEAGGAARVVVLSDGITPIRLPGGIAPDDGGHAGGEEPAEDSGHAKGGDQPGGGAAPDPHVWWDPANVIAWTDAVEQALSDLDPAGAGAYAANAGAYRDELRTLDAWIEAEVATIPMDRRVLVTDHQVMGYFAARYGLAQVGAVVPGYSTLAEPSAGEVAALEDAIRRLAVPAIFVGQTVNPGLAERIAADTGTRLVFIHAESLGAPGGPAGTYLDMMRSNVTAIVDALAAAP